jgi:hypothetical protein
MKSYQNGHVASVAGFYDNSKMPSFFSPLFFFIPALGFTDEIHVMILLEHISWGIPWGSHSSNSHSDSWPAVACRSSV